VTVGHDQVFVDLVLRGVRFAAITQQSTERKANTLHETLPAGVGTEGVEHWHRQLDDAEYALLIRLLQQLKPEIQIAQTAFAPNELFPDPIVDEAVPQRITEVRPRDGDPRGMAVEW
jgi:hypothetical protein